MGIQDTAMIG